MKIIATPVIASATVWSTMARVPVKSSNTTCAGDRPRPGPGLTTSPVRPSLFPTPTLRSSGRGFQCLPRRRRSADKCRPWCRHRPVLYPCCGRCYYGDHIYGLPPGHRTHAVTWTFLLKYFKDANTVENKNKFVARYKRQKKRHARLTLNLTLN